MYILDPQLRATVRALADTNKNATNPLVKEYSASVWGEVAADTGLSTRLRLAGQQYDQQSKLYYMRARYYDPALGRSLSEDPIGIAGGMNLYTYAANDPVNAWDPSGLGPDDGKCDIPDPSGIPRCPDIGVESGQPDPGGIIDWVTIEPGARTHPGPAESGRGGGGGGSTSSTGRYTKKECAEAVVAFAFGATLDFFGAKWAVGAVRYASAARSSRAVAVRASVTERAIHEARALNSEIGARQFGKASIAALSWSRGIALTQLSSSPAGGDWLGTVEGAAAFLPILGTRLRAVRCECSMANSVG